MSAVATPGAHTAVAEAVGVPVLELPMVRELSQIKQLGRQTMPGILSKRLRSYSPTIRVSSSRDSSVASTTARLCGSKRSALVAGGSFLRRHPATDTLIN